MTLERSPSGKLIIPSEGPKDAEIILIGESPASEEMRQARPFVGAAGKLLDRFLNAAAIDRSKAYVMNLVPVQPYENKFAKHRNEDIEWAKVRFAEELLTLPNAKVYVPLGANPLEWLTGLDTIGLWRGSPLAVDALRRKEPLYEEDYLPLLRRDPLSALYPGTLILPTFHPSAVLRQFEWHPLFLNDLQRVNRFSKTAPIQQRRVWYYDNPDALIELADRLTNPARIREHSGFIAIDTEQPLDGSPFIIGIATDIDVHVFAWPQNETGRLVPYRAALEAILSSPWVLKIAHNLQHDWTFLKVRLQLDVAQPWFDTMGGAHILNEGLERNLSPGIAARFTNWPYHKWLAGPDMLRYNGLDAIVAYDAYWNEIEALQKSNLYEVAKHDHWLLAPLLDMQWRGFSINEQERLNAERELDEQRKNMADSMQDDVNAVVDSKLSKFEKPHLFQKEISCDCCGGGKNSRYHCWKCGGLSCKPKSKADYIQSDNDKKLPVAILRERLPECRVCGGTGKVTKRLVFNPNSDDQKADVLYRGLGLFPRRYKGKETVRVGQLEDLTSKHPLVSKFIDYARVDAEYDTVHRLSPDPIDEKLHCVFNPFGTDSGRVSSSEGLIQVGTNAMNIPKSARRLVVPRPGYVFLYPDMEQVEGRAIAAHTQDPALMALFNDPTNDVHILVRDDTRALGLAAFSRDQAKRLEYATFYGGRAVQVAKELTDEAYRKGEGMPMSLEQTELAMRFLLSNRFRAIEKWHRDVEQELYSHRTVTSITGRVFHFNGYIIDPKTHGVDYEILKKAYSRVPQDIGAWILAEGLLDLFRDYWSELHHGLIHVHDALLYEVLESELEEAKDILSAILTRTKWGMRFPAKIKVGTNWQDAS